MATENVIKYIDASLEGSLLKYDLDEPLIEGNMNVYKFRISLSNISEAQNAFWKFLLDNRGAFEANFRSYKNSKGEGTTVQLHKETQIEGDKEVTYLLCEVPDGSGHGNELYGNYRLDIWVRGSATFENRVHKYTTITLSNPPMVYPSGAFQTTIDLSEETYLRSFMNNFTGGKEGELIVKRSDDDYDIDWIKSVPGALIFGGTGTFRKEGYEVVLTPQAIDVLLERRVIAPENTTDLPKTAIIDFSKPFEYRNLEFLSTNLNDKFNGGVGFEVGTGDKLVSNGVEWILIPVSGVGLQSSWLRPSTHTSTIYTIPSTKLEISNSTNGTGVTFDLPTLGGGSIENFRNIANFAGNARDVKDASTDEIDNDTAKIWVNIGNCTVAVDSTDLTNGYVAYPKDITVKTFKGAYIENIIDPINATVIQHWIGTDGFQAWRSSDGWQWQSIIPIIQGGTGAKTAEGARTSLNVYSKEEVDNELNKKADLTSTASQKFTGSISGINLTSRGNSSDEGVFLNLDKADGGPAAKFWKNLTSGKTFLTTYPLDAADDTDRINYVLAAPKKGDGDIERQVYHTGNIIYRTDKTPDFNAELNPAGTICLVKVSES